MFPLTLTVLKIRIVVPQIYTLLRTVFLQQIGVNKLHGAIVSWRSQPHLQTQCPYDRVGTKSYEQ